MSNGIEMFRSWVDREQFYSSYYIGELVESAFFDGFLQLLWQYGCSASLWIVGMENSGYGLYDERKYVAL